MARKTTELEIKAYLSTRYCYTYSVCALHMVPINVSVLCENDDRAEYMVKKLYNNPGTTVTLLSRAATIIML